jgi:hypothetical protein
MYETADTELRCRPLRFATQQLPVIGHQIARILSPDPCVGATRNQHSGKRR